ncbi:MAG TPA: hypothetical protein VMT64_08245 [Candidatus Binataceae bacterium]|nr:hypothetical protein [Candidatus Binataceae bacterium]
MAAFALSVFLPAQAYCDPDPSQSQDWTVDGFDYFGHGKLTSMVLETYTAKGHQAQDDGMVASDKLQRTSLRIFYGLTDWANLFLQFNTAKPNGQSYEPEGFEGGFHFDFYEGHHWKLGLAWENEWQRAPKYVDNALDMDFHPLIEYDAPLSERYLSFLVNPIFEKNFIGAGCWEGSYSAQILYHWSKDISAGVEAYGDVGEFKDMGQEHEQGAYLMPVLNYRWFSFGPGIGLTAGSDRLVLKLNLAVPIDTGIRGVMQ